MQYTSIEYYVYTVHLCADYRIMNYPIKNNYAIKFFRPAVTWIIRYKGLACIERAPLRVSGTPDYNWVAKGYRTIVPIQDRKFRRAFVAF